MVPKLHKKGASFKGAANYLLHDKGRAKTAERVAWTDVRNLAVNDPHAAWRIMAATAIDQNRLKESAGVKATGRKSSTPVLHLTLAWHPEEKQKLSPEEMLLAADGAIKVLGAQSHQSLIIAHTDEDHPHVHLLINRVHPETGKILSSSKEKLNLSRWAEKYEKERGKIYCEERVLNNEARDRGEYTRGQKDEYRRLIEEARSVGVANDDKNANELRQEQRTKDRALAARGRRLAEEHSGQWTSLISELRRSKEKAVKRGEKSNTKALALVRKRFRPEWRALNRKHDKECALFEAREKQLLGRFQNAFQAVELAYSKEESQHRPRLGKLFKVLTTRAARYNALQRRQSQDRAKLFRAQKEAEQTATRRIDRLLAKYMRRMRRGFLKQRETLITSQAGDRHKLRDEWRGRHVERQSEWHELARKSELKSKAKIDFSQATGQNVKDKESAREKIRAKLREDRDRDKDRGGR